MDHQEHHHAAHETATMHHHLNALEQFFETYLHKKLNIHLPKGLKDFIVQYGPWITLVILVISLITILPSLRFLLGMEAAYSQFYAVYGYYYHMSPLTTLAIVLNVIAMVMELIAVPALLKRKLSGWHLVYYALLVSALGQLLTLNIVGLIIGLAIGMYVLFQIREYYH